MDPILRRLFLSPDRGAYPSLAAACCEPIPLDDEEKKAAPDDDAIYLTPYYVPFGGKYGGLYPCDVSLLPAYIPTYLHDADNDITHTYLHSYLVRLSAGCVLLLVYLPTLTLCVKSYGL